MKTNNELIESLVKDFKSTLQSKGHTPRTSQSYANVLRHYLRWIGAKNLNYLSLTYEQLLGYIKQGRDKGQKVNTINQHLLALRKFYKLLLQNHPQDKAILLTIQALEDLKQRGGTRYILHDLLSEEQLENIYTTYPTSSLIQKRNKCILGMMIYQALRAGDLSRIKIEDLSIEKSTVYIAGTKSSKSRTLPLVVHQISALQKYVLGVRSALLNYSKKSNNDYLFIGKNGTGTSKNLRVNLSSLYQQIRKEYPKLSHIHQIRSSVIRHWLRQDNIRLVQYKLGHRYLSSTQLYLEGDIESLQQQIDRLHPLNDKPSQ